MIAADFASTLQMHGFKVKGKRAQCPGHQGKNLSLSFSDGNDGKLLLRCFSHSCHVSEIMEGVGLSVKDLFPPENTFDKHKYKKIITQKKNNDECITHYTIIVLANSDVNKGKNLSEHDRQRVIKAMNALNRYDFSHSNFKKIIRERALLNAYLAWRELPANIKYKIGITQ